MARKRYFEWIDGDYKGNVVGLESISELDGEIFYNFDDGESCNQRFISKMTKNIVDLKDKFMVEVENPYNIWGFEEINTAMPNGIKADEDDQIPTLHDFLKSNAGGGNTSAEINDSDLGKMKLVPPKRTQNIQPLPNIEDYREKKEEIKIDSPKQNVIVPEPVVSEQNNDVVEVKNETPVVKRQDIFSDPVAILVDSCKKHSTEIPLSLSIDLPMKSLYDIANNEFDCGGDRFIEYIVKGINTDVILVALKDALKSAYESTDVQQ